MKLIEYYNKEMAKSIAYLNLFSKKQIEEYVKSCTENSQRVDDYLLSSGLISDEQALKLKVNYIGKDYINIDKIGYEEDVVLSVSEEFLNTQKFIPLKKELTDRGKNYIVAIWDVFNGDALYAARNIYGFDVTVCYESYNKILSVFNLVHSKIRVQEAYNEYSSTNTKTDVNEDELEDVGVEFAPIVRMVENILREAIASKASDIHIEPYETLVRVRYRIDGILYESSTFNINMYSAMITRLKIIGGINITEKRVPQDGRFSMKINNEEYDFRLSTLPMVHGEKVVIRVLDTQAFSFDLNTIGFTDNDLKNIRPILKSPHGIVLLTGPTGCGKSTTLYSFIRELNKNDVNIVSVEDPVEYSISGVNQVQVNNKVNLTFASALRSILRQDPNVIMIGEIRDEETAEIAIRSAITGHLVLSTLHTNDATGSIIRLIDMGVPRYLVSDALQMVISQRLVRKLCPECKKKVHPTAHEAEELGISESDYIYKPHGCTVCHNTGYKGRTGIHEILILDNTIRNMIVSGATSEEITEYLKNKADYKTLDQALIELIKNGTTSYSEIFTIRVE